MNTSAKGSKKSGISSKRAYELQTALVSRVGDTFSYAVHFQLTYEQIGARLQEFVYNTPEWERLPIARRSYILGYCQAKRDDLYRHHFTWVLSCDGKLMTSKEVDALTAAEKAAGKDTSPDYRSPWSRIDSDQSRHVWVKDGKPLLDKSIDARFR